MSEIPQNTDAPEAEEPAIEVPGAVSSWETWKRAPSPTSMSSVIKSVDPVIKSSINRFPHINQGLMRGEAKRLTIQAIKSYDPLAGTSLSTHVFNHLRPLSRFAERETKVVSVPRDLKTEVAGFVRAKQNFMEEEGREPSDGELQDILGVSAKKMKRLNAGAFYEMPEGQVESAIDIDTEESPRLNLWADYVYHDLPARDKLIMDYRMGRNGKTVMEPNEIAAALKIDPSYVRKRASYIANKILDGLNRHNS